MGQRSDRALDSQQATAFQNICRCIDSLAFTKYTAGSHLPVWRKPRNEPLVEVDRAVLVTVHHQATVLMLTTIRPFPQGHILLVLALMAHLRRIAFANDI